MDIAELGFTKEELQERIVDQCCESVMHGVAYDEDGEPYDRPSSIASALRDAVKERIDKSVAEIADKHVLPIVQNHIETLIIQETNTYGEKKGKEYTLIEYLVSKAESYLLEKVDYSGKGKGASDWSWRAKGTRVSHLVHKHLDHSITSAMKEAVGKANETITEGLKVACEVSLKEIATKLKVKVDTGR